MFARWAFGKYRRARSIASLVVIDRCLPAADDPLLAARARDQARAFAADEARAPRSSRKARSPDSQHTALASLPSSIPDSRAVALPLGICGLPPMPRTREREDAESFLRRIRDGA